MLSAVLVLSAMVFAPSSAAAAWDGQWWISALSIEQSWQVSRGAGVTVAVIDTGVNPSNPYLAGQLLPGRDFTGTDPTASDPGDGIDPSYSHGTNMAALIAGRSDGGGMVGIAPDAKILPIKVAVRTGDINIQSRAVADGIMWAVASGAQIINLSLAGFGLCGKDEATAVAYAYAHDVIVVAGAGNSPGPVEAPASCPGSLAISADDRTLAPWPSSGSGPEIAFSAPGVDMVQTTIDGHTLINAAGTSDSTAIVSGIFALLRARFPSETARQLVTRALHNTDTGGHGSGNRVDDKLGYGEIVPYEALTIDPAPGAANPIYDAFDKALKPATSAPNSTGPSGTGSSPTPRPDASGNVPVRSDQPAGGSGLPVVLIAAIGAGVIILALIVVFVTRSRRRVVGPPGPTQWGP